MQCPKLRANQNSPTRYSNNEQSGDQMGGAGSGWFASAGHVPQKHVDELHFTKSAINTTLPDGSQVEGTNPNGFVRFEENPNLTSVEVATIDEYVALDAHGYQAMNGVMRGNLSGTKNGPGEPEGYLDFNRNPIPIPEIKDKIKNINNAIDANPLKQDQTVYRGIPAGYADQLIEKGSMTDNAFQSTSVDFNVAHNFGYSKTAAGSQTKWTDPKTQTINVIQFTAKAGEGSVFSDHYGENELLLKGGTFKAVGVTTVDKIYLDNNPKESDYYLKVSGKQLSYSRELLTSGMKTRIITIERTTKDYAINTAGA